MRKQELLRRVAERTGLSVKKVGEVYDEIVNAIKDAVVNGEPIRVGDIGIIKPVVRAARKARNPQTGEIIEVPEHKTIKFKPSSTFKNVLNG